MAIEFERGDGIINAYEVGKERRRTEAEDAYKAQRRPIVDAQADRSADQKIQAGDQAIRRGDQDIAAGEREADAALRQRSALFLGAIERQIANNPNAKPSDVMRSAPPEVLRAVGLDNPEAQAAFAQHYDADPSLLRAHAQMQGGAGRQIKSSTAVKNAEGVEGFLQTYEDGYTEFVPGYEQSAKESTNPFNVASTLGMYQDKATGQWHQIPGAASGAATIAGAKAQAGTVGKAVGENQAEDLPWSAADARKAAQVIGNKAAREKNLEAGIDRAFKQISDFSAGVGAASKVIPGTPAANLAATLNTVGSIIGLDELQRLRDNSKTGGALGSVTEKEHAFLQSVIAAIAQEQEPKELRKSLTYLKEAAKESWARVQAAYDADLAAQGPVGAAPTVPPAAAGPARRRFNAQTGRLE